MRTKTNEHYLKKELYELFKTDSTFFNFLQENSLDGLWYWNLENIEDEWMSPRFWEVLGYDPEKEKHSSYEWQDIIFKEDLEKATINFEKHLQDPKHPYDQIVRYKHKDGSTVWIQCRGIAIRDESGKATRMLGVHTNITKLQNQIIDLNHLKGMTHQLLVNLGEDLDYQMISDNLLSLSGAKFVAFNLYDKDGKHFTTKAYSGSKKTINKAIDIMGIKLDDRKWHHVVEERKYSKCTTSSLVSVIKANGDIPLCVLKRNELASIIGNIYDGGFIKNWYGEKHYELIDNINLKQCRKPCKHDSYNIVNEAFNLDFYHKNFI